MIKKTESFKREHLEIVTRLLGKRDIFSMFSKKHSGVAKRVEGVCGVYKKNIHTPLWYFSKNRGLLYSYIIVCGFDG